MSHKNSAGHSSNFQIAAEAIIVADVRVPDVSSQKRKEEAKQILYLDRV